MRRLQAAAALLILICACSKEPPERAPVASSVSASSSASPIGAQAAADDPEPPTAQPDAEAVLHADFNADKTTTLEMNITTLVDSTSGLTGFNSTVAGTASSLDDRLTRLGAKVSDSEVTIRLSGAVLFDFDSDRIRADAERMLLDVGEVLEAYPKRPVRVEGHTDSVASDAYNQKLSERRAAAVASWFTRHGIESSRLRAAGFGESRPVADNGTAEGRQQNRRVEIVVEKH